MRHIVGWQRHDTPGVEYAEVETDPVGLDGVVVFADEGLACAVTYRVTCDPSGITTSAVVRLRRAGVISSRELARRADGVWTVDERVVPALGGLCDVDLSVTPSTNTLPIHASRAEPAGSVLRITVGVSIYGRSRPRRCHFGRRNRNGHKSATTSVTAGLRLRHRAHRRNRHLE